MAETPKAQGELSGQVLMYRTPEPLDRDRHKGLGMTPSDTPFGFAAKVSAVPINVAEFGYCAVNYPIIFAGEQRQPVAVMGVRAEENLFIEENGAADKGAYLPAFIRRYPFVLADDKQAQRLVVCLDTSAQGLVKGGALQLFDKGEPTDFTKNALNFIEEFEKERARTDSFVRLIQELDLLEVRQTLYTAPEPGSEPVAISEYFAMTEERVMALPEAKIMELFKNGALAQIYAHLVSLNGWDKLMARALARGPMDLTPIPRGDLPLQ